MAMKILSYKIPFVKRIDFLIILFLLLFTLINRYQLLHSISTHYYTNVYNIYSWILMWNCKCLENFDFNNYWATNAMYPYENALAFSETLIGLTPLACPIHYITKNNILAINIVSLLILWLTASCMYLILKRLLNDSLAALAGSIIFAFYPWTMRQFTIGRIHMISFFCLPFIFFANLRFWQHNKQKYLIIFSLFYLWAFLISLYTGIFLCIILLIWNLMWFFKEKNLFTLKKIIKWFIAISIVWILMIPILYKHYQAGRDLGSIRTSEQQIHYTGPVWSWFIVSEDNWFWGQLFKILPIKTIKDTPIENAMFPGIIALISFLISFFIKNLPPWLSSLKWTGLIAAILAIGPYTIGLKTHIPLPFLIFFYAFPPMKATRNPHRLSIFAIFIIAILLSFILSSIKLSRKKLITLKIFIITLICLET